MPWNVIDNPCQAKFGVWNDSGVAGYGILLNSTRQFGLIVACDDGGVALAANWYSAIFGQTLIGYANAARTNVSAFGVTGEAHIAADTTPGGNYAGLYGYAELQAGKTYSGTRSTSLSGLLAGIDLNATAVCASGAFMSAIAAGAGTLAGTHTGKVTVLHVTNPGSGTFDGLFSLDNATGCYEAAGSHGSTAAGRVKFINSSGTTLYLHSFSD
jgi:hypothetical protein